MTLDENDGSVQGAQAQREFDAKKARFEADGYDVEVLTYSGSDSDSASEKLSGELNGRDILCEAKTYSAGDGESVYKVLVGKRL